jgi:hypothetical protein
MAQPSAYECFVAEGRELGRLDEARDTILRIGQCSCGPPDQTTRARIEGMTDLKRLRQVIDERLSPTDWSDLLSDL